MAADAENSSLLIALLAPAHLSWPAPLEPEAAELANMLS